MKNSIHHNKTMKNKKSVQKQKIGPKTSSSSQEKRERKKILDLIKKNITKKEQKKYENYKNITKKNISGLTTYENQSLETVKEYTNSQKFKTNKLHDEILENIKIIGKLCDEEGNNNTSRTHKTKNNKSKLCKNDFYEYSNYFWLKNAKKEFKNKEKKYYNQYDAFRFLQERVNYQLIDIVINYISKNSQTRQGKELYNVFKSVIVGDTNLIIKNMETTIKDIDNFYKTDDLVGLLVYTNKTNIISQDCPIYWDSKPSIINNKHNSCYFEVPILPPYNSNLFIENTERSKKYFENEEQFIKKIFGLVKQLDKQKPTGFYKEIGKQIRSCISSSASNATTGIYKTIEEFIKDFPDFPNPIRFFSLMGYANHPKEIIVRDVNYFKKICKILKQDWKNEQWKRWFYFIHLKQQVRFGKKTLYYYLHYIRKNIYDESKYPTLIRSIFLLTITFKNLLTNEYIKFQKQNDKNNQQRIDLTTNLFYDMREIFIGKIRNNKELQKHTKDTAIKKLESAEFVIGDVLMTETDPLLNYSDKDVWGNLLKIYDWRRKRLIESEEMGRVLELQNVDWKKYNLSGETTYLVSSTASIVNNRIYIPLAYIQAPFVQVETGKSIIFSISSIGFTLAHELSHLLGTYAVNTQELDISNKDRIRMNEKFKDIKKQSIVFMKRDGITEIDALNGINVEEIYADITALSICEKYIEYHYSNIQSNGNIADISNIIKQSYKYFYNYFSTYMRQFLRKRTMYEEVFTNSHFFDKYRINISLSRSSIFKTIYNIEKTDKMYWEKNDDDIW